MLVVSRFVRLGGFSSFSFFLFALAHFRSLPLAWWSCISALRGFSCSSVAVILLLLMKYVLRHIREKTVRHARAAWSRLVSSHHHIRSLAGSARVNSSPGQHGTTATRGRPRALASPPCCCRSAGTIDRTAHRSPPRSAMPMPAR